MHLSNILLVLSLSTPFFSTLTASLAYLEVDTIVADTTIGTIDSIDPEIDVISPFQAYDDDVISYLIDDEGAASVVRRSRSRSQVARADHAEGQCEKRAVADWTYVGCTVDGEKRALPYLAREGGMTPQRCIAICEAQSSKYVYAGVQYATQCFCGEKLLNGQGAKVAESQCNVACGGDNKQKCGGAYRNGLYQRKASTTPTPSTTTKPTSTSTTAHAATSTSVGSNYPVTGTIQNTRRLGCFSDSFTSRMLTGATYRQNDNTPDRCWTFCASKGYLVAGVQSGTYCYCGNTVDWARKVSDGECNMACPGGGTAKCGAGNRNEVYTRATNIKVGTPAVPSSGRKYLWAHHMIGNTYSYNQDIWRNDITLAADAGIDGFALNMGRDDWQPARVADAYAVAKSFGSSFKLFFSLDMTSFPCSTAAQAVQYATLVSSYRSHPNQAFYQNKLLLTLFDGAYCTFGQANVNAGWAYFRAQMTARNTPVYIMPSLFVDLAHHNWYDGHFDWDNSWPEAGQDLDGSRDVQAKAQMTARGKGYMPGISPNFFTYYSPQTYNKNWIYRSDDWLMASRFEQIIQQRASHDMAELITWNDFGESHYVGPIRPDQPNSQGWTNGMPHTGWLHLIRHYAQAYRTGTYHSARDSLYLWSRPHPKSGKPTNVSPGLSRPRNADYTEDNLYVVAILSTASDVVVTAGTNTITYKNLPAGLNKISVASGEGSVGAQIVRGGATVRNYSSGSSFRWSKTFRDWNFNYFVASAE